MLRRRVNGYDMAYIELGNGPPLVCVHGTLGDFRVWSPVLGPLSQQRRVFSLSLRHFFPERWNGKGSDYTIAQHVADVIGFIETLGEPADLMGHSRGGHIAFRVAQQRPELLRRLVPAEPGGNVDASLGPAGPAPADFGDRYTPIAERVAAGDIDGALALFSEIVGTQGGWAGVPPAVRQTWRDNVTTLLGQVHERRAPFSRADAEAIHMPTLFVGGTDTPGPLPGVLRVLAAHVPVGRVAMLPNARHFMFEDDPPAFCAAVLGFLSA
jgi:pimeloyl-ACP methyl ester carboxylesterase